MNDNKMNEEKWEDIKNIEMETIKQLGDKTDIEKIMGIDNIKYNKEKSKFLGFNEKDVIKYFSFDELDLPKTYESLARISKEQKVGKAIINGNLNSETILKIVEIMHNNDLPFTIVKDPVYKEEVGLEFIRHQV